MKNIKFKVIVTLTALSFFIAAPSVFAGNGKGPGNGTGPIYNITDGAPVQVTGIVANIGTRGSGIGIDTGSEIITVFGMGPLAFWDASNIAKPEIGEEIIVNGYEITLSDGSARIIAESVIIGGQELILRDSESGLPLWRGGFGKGQKSGGCISFLPVDFTQDSIILARGGNGKGGGNGPKDGSGNGGNGPKDGSGNGKKSGTCINS